MEIILSNFIIPIIFIFIFIFCKYKKINTYETFVNGAKKALPLVVDIFPYIATIIIATTLMRVSGITDFLSSFFSPLFSLLGIPKELTHLVLLRPFTGSGSLAILKEILSVYGADSYISRCACVIMGCSETIFYVTSVYLSKTKIKKLLYAIPVALICSIFGCVIGCLLCRII